MPVFIATKTINATPAVSVTSNSTSEPSYGVFKASLGPNVYHVYQLYLASVNLLQISSVMKFKKYDASAVLSFHDLIPAIDPNQRQSTIFYKLHNKPVIVDGKDSFYFMILPLTTLQFKMYSKHVESGGILNNSQQPALGPSNFTQFETATGLYNFFDSFNERL